jgi:hypothetical protein
MARISGGREQACARRRAHAFAIDASTEKPICASFA